jgi:hypothetical protein
MRVGWRQLCVGVTSQLIRLSGNCRGELMFAAIYGNFEVINRHMWRHKRIAKPAITAIPNEPLIIWAPAGAEPPVNPCMFLAMG